MRTRTKRAAATVGLLAVVGLSACSAEVDPSGDGVNVDVDASEPNGEGEGEGEG